MYARLSASLLLASTVLWSADLVWAQNGGIVIGTTSYPSGKRSEKCARVVMAQSKAKSPGRVMARCMNTLTTLLAEPSGVLIGTVTVPEDLLTMKCLELLRLKNTNMPGWYVNECRRTTTTTVVPGSPTVVTNGGSFITRHVNDNVVLSCTVTGKGNYSVTWMLIRPRTVPMPIFVDTKRLHMDPRYRLEREGNGTFNMKINRIAPEDEGVYACQVNTLPTNIYVNITLQVVVAPTIIGVYPPSGNMPYINNYRFAYNESDDVRLACEADGSPKPIVQWRRIATDEVVSDRAVLSLDDIGREQGGFFKCTADNGYLNTAQEQWIEIIVQFKPEIEAEERDVRVKEYDYYLLRCNVRAKPLATYSWTKDGEVIPDSIDKRSNTIYVLMRVDPDIHYGVYRCQATNLLGTSEDVIEVSGRLRAPNVVSNEVGTRRHSYKLQWVMGTGKQQGTAGYTPVDGYVLSYYGWWYQDNGRGGVERVFSHKRDAALEANVTHDPALSRQFYILRDLRANVTYEVMLTAYNRYGTGDNTTFTFRTAVELPPSTAQVNVWEATTAEPVQTTASMGSAKQWRNSGSTVNGCSTQTLILAVLVRSLSLLL